MSEFSKRLKQAMVNKNIKQSELVRMTGISKGALSCYINGKYEPKYENVVALAKSLDVSEYWLAGKGSAADIHSNPIKYDYLLSIISSYEMHNSLVDLMNKLKEKYPNDKTVIYMNSCVSSLLECIDNLRINGFFDDDIIKEMSKLADDDVEDVKRYIKFLISKNEKI